jgi:hypothetical protein
VPKNLQGKAAFLLAELLLLKNGIDPDKNRPLLEETIKNAEQETTVSLGDVPKQRRSKAAEVLAQFRILMYEINSCRYTRNVKYKDLDVWDPSVEDAAKVFVQVKSSSLKKHSRAIYIDSEPLERLEGWYIAVIEQEPEDIFLYIPDHEMKRLMKECGKDAKEYGKVKHHKGRRFIAVRRNWDILKRFEDPNEFIRAVRR